MDDKIAGEASKLATQAQDVAAQLKACLLYTSPSPRD